MLKMKIKNYFLLLFFIFPISVEASFIWKNQVDTQHYIFENYYNDLERFHNEDDHLKNSELLKVPLPKINRIISDYDRYIDYRTNKLSNNYLFTNKLWKRVAKNGKILDRELCLNKLANFEVDPVPNHLENEFKRCHLDFQDYAVKDVSNGIKLFQKLFEKMSSGEDKWIFKKNKKTINFNPTGYNIPGVLATFITFYSANYDYFELDGIKRKQINNYFVKKILEQNFDKTGDGNNKFCPIMDPNSLSKDRHNVNNCGSLGLRFAAAELALGITLQNDKIWRKGLWDLDYNLSMFNEDGFFIPHSAKGCRALGYLWDTSRLLSINSEILNLIGFNFLDYKMRHGKKVKFAYEQLFKQYEDVTITNYIAEKAIGSFACGNKPYKTHDEFIKWQDKDGSGDWIPNKDNFINWSLRFVVENNPELINDKLLDDIKVHWQLGAYFSIQPMEIYNANFALNHLDFWNKKLMEFEKRKEQKAKEEENNQKKIRKVAKDKLKYLINEVENKLIQNKLYDFDTNFIFNLTSEISKHKAEGDDIVKSSIRGYFSINGLPLNDIINKQNIIFNSFQGFSTLASIIKTKEFEAIGIKMTPILENILRETSNDAHNKCGRIAKPSTWLVFVLSSNNKRILEIQKCYIRKFKEASPDIWLVYKFLALSIPSIGKQIYPDDERNIFEKKEKEQNLADAEALKISQEENRARLKANAERIKKEKQKTNEIQVNKISESKKKYGKLLAQVENDLLNDGLLNKYHQIQFSQISAKRVENSSEGELKKASIDGVLVFDSLSVDEILNHVNDYKPFKKISTMVAHIGNENFEAFGIRMTSDMENLFNEPSGKARNDCGRIAKPSEWLVFLLSSSDKNILNIQKCHSKVFKSFSNEVWDSYKTLGLSSNTIINYLKN